MARIFISYRRDDSEIHTTRIYNALKSSIWRHQIYRDINSGAPGNWKAQIDLAILNSSVVLVVIGETWLTITDASGNRRLDQPDDIVRQEIELALRHKKTIILVIVGKATVPPAAALPLSLSQLPDFNAVFIRNDPDFEHDIKKLLRFLRPKFALLRILSGVLILLAISLSLPLLAQRIQQGQSTFTPESSAVQTNETPFSTIAINPTDTVSPSNTPGLTSTSSTMTGLHIIIQNENDLLVYGSQDIDLNGFTLSSARRTVNLVEDFDILQFNNGILKQGNCLRYHRDNSETTILPTACSPDQVETQLLANVDIFWYDSNEKYLTLAVKQGDQKIGDCPAGNLNCDF